MRGNGSPRAALLTQMPSQQFVVLRRSRALKSEIRLGVVARRAERLAASSEYPAPLFPSKSCANAKNSFQSNPIRRFEICCDEKQVGHALSQSFARLTSAVKTLENVLVVIGIPSVERKVLVLNLGVCIVFQR